MVLSINIRVQRELICSYGSNIHSFSLHGPKNKTSIFLNQDERTLHYEYRCVTGKCDSRRRISKKDDENISFVKGNGL